MRVEQGKLEIFASKVGRKNKPALFECRFIDRYKKLLFRTVFGFLFFFDSFCALTSSCGE